MGNPCTAQPPGSCDYFRPVHLNIQQNGSQLPALRFNRTSNTSKSSSNSWCRASRAAVPEAGAKCVMHSSASSCGEEARQQARHACKHSRSLRRQAQAELTAGRILHSSTAARFPQGQAGCEGQGEGGRGCRPPGVHAKEERPFAPGLLLHKWLWQPPLHVQSPSSPAGKAGKMPNGKSSMSRKPRDDSTYCSPQLEEQKVLPAPWVGGPACAMLPTTAATRLLGCTRCRVL